MKVYSMANEIQLMRPKEFKILLLCLRTFHTVKTLLRCIGKSLEGSGAENVWIEAGVYGPSVIQNSSFNGRHYSRSLDAKKTPRRMYAMSDIKEVFFRNKEYQNI